MNPSDLKKLVAGFLLVASFAGSLAFLATLPVPAPEEKPEAKAPVRQSAFVEALPSENGRRPALEPDNLTDRAASGMARKLLALNPQGPLETLGQADALTAKVPDPDEFIEGFLTDPANYAELYLLKREAAPPQVSAADLKVDSRATAEEYRAATEKIWQERLASPAFLRLLSSQYSLEAVNSAEVVFDEALREAKMVRVPQELVPLHLSLMRMIGHERNMLRLGSYVNQDPLKASLLYQLQEKHLAEVVREFEAEFGKAKAAFGNSGRTGDISFWNPFAARTAHAQWIVFDPGNFAQAVKEFIYKSVIEVVKDRFVHRMVQQVITWVQGGGSPQFVTNWKGFLRDASNEAVGDFLNEVAPQLCQSFGPLIRVSLLPVSGADVRPVTCTLDQVVDNIENFYDDFTEGGWIAYGAVLQPQNNFYGALIQTSDMVARKAAEAEEAAEAEAEAGNGYQGTKKCVQFEEFTPYDRCVDEGGDPDACSAIENAFDTIKRCIDYDTTTPAATIESLAGQTLVGPLHRIVNAQDVAALFSALINSALNKLVTLGARGLSGLNAQTTGEPRLPDPCGGLSGPERDRCRRDACNGLPADMQEECRESIEEGDENAGPCGTGEVLEDGECVVPGLPPAPPIPGTEPTDPVCGTKGNDIANPPAVNSSNVAFLVANAGPWSETAVLNSVSFSGEEVCVDYSSPGWPPVSLGGVERTGSIWFFAYRDGQWKGFPFGSFRVGQTCKGAAEVRTKGASLLGDFAPKTGETYGFMVSGLAETAERNAEERSNIVMQSWQGPVCTPSGS